MRRTQVAETRKAPHITGLPEYRHGDSKSLPEPATKRVSAFYGAFRGRVEAHESAARDADCRATVAHGDPTGAWVTLCCMEEDRSLEFAELVAFINENLVGRFVEVVVTGSHAPIARFRGVVAPPVRDTDRGVFVAISDSSPGTAQTGLTIDGLDFQEAHRTLTGVEWRAHDVTVLLIVMEMST